MRRRFAPVVSKITEILYGPEPVGQAGAAVLAGYSHGQLDGGPRGGYPHYGMKGEPALSFTGYASSPQRFQGAAQLGASKNLSVPAATAPAALPSWLADWTRLEGVVP
jgi:hypothetical protein